MDNGWIKDYRKVEGNPIVTKDNDYFRIWYYLLHKATHEERDILFNGKRMKLKPGQFTIGRNQIAVKCHCNTSKVQRVLKTFEIEHQIEQQMSNKCRLITIVNWDMYQQSEHQNEQQVNIKRTSSEHQVNTKQECKNVKNVKKTYIYIVKQVIDYLNSKTGSKYKHTTRVTQNKIIARLNEGYKLNDFIVVIDKKYDEWKETEFEKFLRPETLFGIKFESYLNQSAKKYSPKPQTSRERLREIEEKFLKGE